MTDSSHPERAGFWIESHRFRRILLEAILIIAAVVAVAWLLYALRKVILLLALTVVFCFLVAPLVHWVERPFRSRGWYRPVHRGLAVAFVYLVLGGVITVALELFLPLLSDQVSAFAKNAPEYLKKVDQYLRYITSLPARYRLPPAWRSAITEGLNQTISSGLDALRSLTVYAVGLTLYVPWLILIPVIGFFCLKDGKLFVEKMLRSLPETGLRLRAAEFLTDVTDALSSYIRAQLLSCLIIGAVVLVGLTLLGTPYSIVLGVIAGLLEFIPVVGPFIVAVTAILVASFESARLAFFVGLFLLLLRLAQDYIIYPRLVSREVEMHPLVVILAVLCGAELGGVIGVFLSVPIAALVIVAWRHWLNSPKPSFGRPP